jgi:hypothetical protein
MTNTGNEGPRDLLVISDAELRKLVGGICADAHDVISRKAIVALTLHVAELCEASARACGEPELFERQHHQSQAIALRQHASRLAAL